ncbi:MAG TPA: putative cytokinetic ring protein SteA [Nocardioidaceae bacterium]|jgi:uncharacterized membrane-anchored protein
MKLSLRKPRSTHDVGVSGTARLDRRTRTMAKRLRPGDIAVIDHVDIDRHAALALIDADVAAVVNIAPSISGRYPNLGPELIVDAGIVLVDDVGSAVFQAVNDGDLVRIEGDTIYRGDTAVGVGVRHDPASVAAAMEAAKDGMASQLEAFSANAVEHLRRERALLLDGEGVPSLSTRVDGRDVLVVLRTFDYAADLRSLRTYIRENSPVLIGVDAGADALLEAGHRPDIVVTGAEDISDRALRCGAEVVAHAGRDGRIPGAERLDRLATPHTTFCGGGTSEDAAILLAHAHGAGLIVMVGSHATLVELLDKGRSAMASSFLTRATVGSSLVDAKAVARLYRHRVRTWVVLLVLLVGIAAVVAAIATTPVGQDWWDQVTAWYADASDWVAGLTS